MKQLAKAELHCHLDGVLDLEMTRAICAEEPGFPVRPSDFADLGEVRDFSSFLAWWQVVEKLRGLEAMRRVLEQHVRRLRRDGVVYAEVMLSAGNVAIDASEAADQWAAFRAWLTEITRPDIDVELLVAFGRSKPAEEVERLVDRIIPLFEAGSIVGIAMAGLEHANPTRLHRRAFARCHETGMGIEIHAGEWCGPESIRDALTHGHPNRIGHAVSLFQDPALIELVLERGIHVEMCPTSNLKTGAVARIEEHPLRRALDLGLSFSINTDDPGPFACCMGSEYALVERALNFSKADFERVYENSIAARFGSGPRYGLSPTKSSN